MKIMAGQDKDHLLSFTISTDCIEFGIATFWVIVWWK